MYQSVQAFSRNNQVLKDNWRDKQSDHFATTCITVVHGNCQEYMQAIEQTRNGVDSSIKQLENMVAELEKEISMQSYAYNLKLDGKINI